MWAEAAAAPKGLIPGQRLEVVGCDGPLASALVAWKAPEAVLSPTLAHVVAETALPLLICGTGAA